MPCRNANSSDMNEWDAPVSNKMDACTEFTRSAHHSSRMVLSFVEINVVGMNTTIRLGLVVTGRLLPWPVAERAS